MVVRGQNHEQTVLPQGKTPSTLFTGVYVVPRGSEEGRRKFPAPLDLIPDRPVHSEWLNRLPYSETTIRKTNFVISLHSIHWTVFLSEA